MVYRYYSKLRPVSMGTFPQNKNFITFNNFGERTMCDSIKDYAWGYVEYSTPLTPEEILSYDLIDGSRKSFYGVYIRKNNITGDVKAKPYKEVLGCIKPGDIEKSGTAFDVFCYWFENKSDADAMIKEYSE